MQEKQNLAKKTLFLLRRSTSKIILPFSNTLLPQVILLVMAEGYYVFCCKQRQWPLSSALMQKRWSLSYSVVIPLKNGGVVSWCGGLAMPVFILVLASVFFMNIHQSKQVYLEDYACFSSPEVWRVSYVKSWEHSAQNNMSKSNRDIQNKII